MIRIRKLDDERTPGDCPACGDGPAYPYAVVGVAGGYFDACERCAPGVAVDFIDDAEPIPHWDAPGADRVLWAVVHAPVPVAADGLERCDTGCKGWLVLEGGEGLVLDRCNDCGIFASVDDVVPLAQAVGIVVRSDYLVVGAVGWEG